MTEHIIWKDNQLHLLDQRRLPFKKVYVKCKTLQDVTRAIKNMTIRGAPLIGIVAAYGIFLGIREILRRRKRITESRRKSRLSGAQSHAPHSGQSYLGARQDGQYLPAVQKFR